MLCSSLGGVPGVPKVHFKGRQGEYYVMVSAVCLELLRVTGLHLHFSPYCKQFNIAGYGHLGTQPLGCVELSRAGHVTRDGVLYSCGGLDNSGEASCKRVGGFCCYWENGYSFACQTRPVTSTLCLQLCTWGCQARELPSRASKHNEREEIVPCRSGSR